MRNYTLRIRLLSDTTFGRGDGVAGTVDTEVQHDAYGLPYLSGRTLKGLLGAECADILHALAHARPDQVERWRTAAQHLFGASGTGLTGAARLRIGPAQLPDDLRAAIARDVDAKRVTRAEILDCLTALRRQTAMDPTSGAPQTETLRTMRVILRDTTFTAGLQFMQDPAEDDLALLAACAKAFRRAGTGRNRGRGRLKAELHGPQEEPVTDALFAVFRKVVVP